LGQNPFRNDLTGAAALALTHASASTVPRWRGFRFIEGLQRLRDRSLRHQLLGFVARRRYLGQL
jgi:hypothetical protein